MKNLIKSILISVFVVLWMGVFHYESLRAMYLNPLFKKELPKIKFLYPPAGWIMFYRVDDRFGHVEIFGQKGDRPHQLLDPRLILPTSTIGYDNVHRGALLAFASKQLQPRVCSYLEQRFSYFDRFWVTYHEYPRLSKDPFYKESSLLYVCE